MDDFNKEMPRLIRLQDGRMIQGYLKSDKADRMDGEAKNEFTLDETGVYFRIGEKPSNPPEVKQNSEEEHLKKLFTDNVFLILANRERILNDSRMLLAPVHVRNGLAYTGEFQRATLGVYLEWWMSTPCSVLFDEHDTMSLIWFLSGSPLSGCNSCARVYEDGKVEKVKVTFFEKLWPRFSDILSDYHEAKKLFQAYTLPEVIDILRQETSVEDYAKSIAEFHRCAKAALENARNLH